ncbi:hypothetical protein BH11BAC1_BH11BAC1_06300 [soil metagenome]
MMSYIASPFYSSNKMKNVIAILVAMTLSLTYASSVMAQNKLQQHNQRTAPTAKKNIVKPEGNFGEKKK